MFRRRYQGVCGVYIASLSFFFLFVYVECIGQPSVDCSFIMFIVYSVVVCDMKSSLIYNIFFRVALIFFDHMIATLRWPEKKIR